MGGNTQEKTTNSSQNSNFSGNTSNQLTPAFGSGGLFANSLGALGGINTNITPGEQGAIDSLSAQGAAGNPFAGGITGAANTLLGGGHDYSNTVNQGLTQVAKNLLPTANGDFTNPSTNPFFAQTTQGLTDAATRALKGVYAGSGRDPGGAGGDFQYNLGRGISDATAPVYANVYNQERQNQLGAANNLFSDTTGAANTLSNLDQTRYGNMATGANLAGTANQANSWGPLLSLFAGGLGRSIPTDAISSILGTASPIAQAFGQNNGTQSGVQNTTGQQTQTTNTPFNPLSLAPLAFAPLSSSGGVGTSLAGGLFSKLFG